MVKDVHLFAEDSKEAIVLCFVILVGLWLWEFCEHFSAVLH